MERHFPEGLYAREQVLEALGTTVLLLRLKTGDAGYSLHLVDRVSALWFFVQDYTLLEDRAVAIPLSVEAE